MTIIARMLFGSHLYGLNTPESDTDYKGIYLPTKAQLLLGTAPKSINNTTGNNDSKNGANDVDEEMYSLSYFIELALKGETVALDLMHSTNPLYSSPEWEFIVENKHRFYTKNLKAFMGYLKRQVAKYSIKGSRLADISRALLFLNFLHEREQFTLLDVWEDLPTGEYLKKVEYDGKVFYEVNAKKYQDTIRVSEVIVLLQKMYDAYGARAKLAEKNDSIDWKACQHALRAGYQLRDIYLHGDFSYPLKETNYMLEVKLGKREFKSDVQFELERIMDEVEELANHSTLPDKPDRKFWDDWLLSVYEERLL